MAVGLMNSASTWPLVATKATRSHGTGSIGRSVADSCDSDNAALGQPTTDYEADSAISLTTSASAARMVLSA